MTARQDRVGAAARWVARQGGVSLTLMVAGMTAFTVAGFLVYGALGWVVAGGCCVWMEALTREEP